MAPYFISALSRRSPPLNFKFYRCISKWFASVDLPNPDSRQTVRLPSSNEATMPNIGKNYVTGNRPALLKSIFRKEKDKVTAERSDINLPRPRSGGTCT